VYGNPGTAGLIPIFIETVIPVLIILLRFSVGRDTIAGISGGAVTGLAVKVNAAGKPAPHLLQRVSRMRSSPWIK
jgi:hypothetical protein